MKLLITVVQDDDAQKLITSLMKEGFGVTKLATTGGFLKAGNTTLLIGVDEDKLDAVIAIIEKVCKSRKQVATSPSPVAGASGMYVPYPIEVTIGGATIFIMDVEQFLKL